MVKKKEEKQNKKRKTRRNKMKRRKIKSERKERKKRMEMKQIQKNKNIVSMNKRSKIKDTIKPDLSVSMKAARIERQKAKMLEPQLFSENKRKKKDTVQLKIYLKILILIIM